LYNGLEVDILSLSSEFASESSRKGDFDWLKSMLLHHPSVTDSKGVWCVTPHHVTRTFFSGTSEGSKQSPIDKEVGI